MVKMLSDPQVDAVASAAPAASEAGERVRIAGGLMAGYEGIRAKTSSERVLLLLDGRQRVGHSARRN